MRGQQVEKVQDLQSGFAGGLNTLGDPSMIRPDQARQLLNCKLSTFGAATKRAGTRRITTITTVANTAGVIYPQTLYMPSMSKLLWTTKITSVTPNVTKLYSGTLTPYTTSYDIWDGYPSLPAVALGTLPNAAYGIALFTDGTYETAYICGPTALSKYNTGGFTATIASAVASNGLAVYNNRLWGFSGNKLYYSDTNNGDTLGNSAAGGGEIIVRTFGTSTIVKLAVIGSSLIIFHTQGISRLTGFGQDDIDVEPQAISGDVAPLHNSITSHAIDVYANIAWVLTQRGLWRVTESSVELVSSPSSPDPTAPIVESLYDPQNCVVYVSRRYLEVWCLIYDASAPETGKQGTYVYNIQLNAWSGPIANYSNYCPWTCLNTAFIAMPDSSGDLRDLGMCAHNQQSGGGDTEFVIYELDFDTVYKDDVNTNLTGGYKYNMVIQPHRMFAGDRQYSKAWRWITLQATYLDQNNPPIVISTALYGGNYTMTCSSPVLAQQVYYLGPKGTGPYLDMIITDTGDNASSFQTIGVEGFFLGQR